MSDFQKMMANLQREYILSLDEKIQDVERAFGTKTSSPIRDIFHKLKGTGATYGIPEISRLGELMESLCEEQPSRLDHFIPQALDLLKSIQATRKSGKAFELEENAEFGRLSKMKT